MTFFFDNNRFRILNSKKMLKITDLGEYSCVFHKIEYLEDGSLDNGSIKCYLCWTQETFLSSLLSSL